MTQPDLSVRIGKLYLENPVLVASGTFGYGSEYGHFVDISLLGGIVTKTLTPEPWPGNPHHGRRAAYIKTGTAFRLLLYDLFQQTRHKSVVSAGTVICC